MTLRRKIFASFAIATAALFAITLICLHAAVLPDYNQVIQYPVTTINNHPTSLSLDTGSSSVVIWLSSADKLGLKAQKTNDDNEYADPDGPATNVSWLSEPARFAVGAQSVTAPLSVLDADNFGGDGIVGWPEVRDEMLVFDAAKRVVYGTNALPPETTNWVKLKIHRAGQLFLEMPLAGGKTGYVLVDTGSPAGLSLAPDAWRAWRQAHPRARTFPRSYRGLSGIAWTTPWARARTVSIGPLTLTNVDVGEASEEEMDRLPDYAGTIGLAALTRLDFCVDGKRNTAYLHPRPPDAYPYSGGDWTVAPSVRLLGDSLLVDSAGFKYADSDYPGAIADLTSALKLNADNVDAWDLRAETHARLGDYSGAIADASHALQIDPTFEDAWQTRGSARADKSDWNGAIADFTRAIALDSNNADAYRGRAAALEGKNDWKGALADLTRSTEIEPENGDSWLVLGAARQNHDDFPGALNAYNKAIDLGTGDTNYAQLYREALLLIQNKAPANFAAGISTWRKSWARYVAQFLAGQIDEKALLAAAEKKDLEDVPGQQCEAYYFIGVMRLVKGDRAGARAYLQKCVNTGEKDYYEYEFARAELKRLPAAGPTSKK